MNKYSFVSYSNIAIIILLLLDISFKVICETNSECHSFYNATKNYLGSKTPYNYIANHEIHFDYPGCTPQRIWSLVRHGTRNPGRSMIDAVRTKLTIAKEIIILKHDTGKGKLCENELSELRTWTPKLDPEEQKMLTHEGEDEMLDLGERFQLRFPKLLPETYSNSTYKFRYTATQRTAASARYFTIGLFGRYTANHVWYPEPLHKDPILRFYKLCEKWKHEVDDNPEAIRELNKFKRSPEALGMLERVSERLGLDEVLPFNDVRLMYLTCAFETAWTPRKPSPWCYIFSKEDLEVLEYAEDLSYYWIDGYGYKLTYEQACPAIGDMMQHLVNKTLPRATFYFTHSGTLLKVLSYLGLHHDEEPLTSDNFKKNKDRLWKVSKIDAFGTNLAFILYRCKNEDKVLVLHQERPVRLKGCPEKGLCPLTTLLKLYDQSVTSCKFKEMCAYNET